MHPINKIAASAALATVVIAGTALVSNSANAGTITVLNPSFELQPPPYANGGCGTGCSYTTNEIITDWTTSGTGPGGLFDPGTTAGNFTYFNSVPNGTTVAWTNSGSISQTVSATAVAGDTYTLDVYVGFRKDIGEGGTVALVINGLTTYATPIGTPVQESGNWWLYTAIYTATASGPISIVLSDTTADAQGDFDNVSLSFVTPTPLPSTWLMLLSGFVGLGFFACRRTKRNVAAALAAA
jgi:hypothetical protein